MIFTIFIAVGFTGFSLMVCDLLCFMIRYTSSYNVVRIRLSMDTKPRTVNVAFSPNLALFTLNSANVVFLFLPSPCRFKKCSLHFAGVKIAQLGIANHALRTLTLITFNYTSILHVFIQPLSFFDWHN